MGRCIEQREKYLSTVLLLHSQGMGSKKISNMIPVSRETIRHWIIKFAPETRNTPVAMKTQKPQSVPATQVVSGDTKVLEERIKELEAKLLTAEIKAEAYDEMINVAEAKFNIPIRKKAGAKQ